MLSHAGKEVLSKAVLQAMPTYIMSTFLLPSTLTKKMDSLLRKFFWSGAMNKRTIHWSNAEKLCTPKDCGGLGFRDFHDFNMALLAKQAWRLYANLNALWARLLKSIYFPKYDFMVVRKGGRPSWVWTCIHKATETVKAMCIRVIENERDTRIGDHP